MSAPWNSTPLGLLYNHVEAERYVGTSVGFYRTAVERAHDTGDAVLIAILAERIIPADAKPNDRVDDFRSLKVRILARIAELRSLEPVA